MRIPDAAVGLVREHGFVVMPGFLGAHELERAQEALWLHYPKPDEYFADPVAHAKYATSGFAGVEEYPYRSNDLNRLAFHPDLVDFAARYLGTDVNGSVTAADGPTRIVPYERGKDVPFTPLYFRAGELDAETVLALGPAGSLFVYRTDVLHRGSNFTAPRGSRFSLLVDYQARGTTWAGKMAWPKHSPDLWAALLPECTVRERDLFGFPRPGDEYWNEQTLADVAARYPGMDMSPYR